MLTSRLSLFFCFSSLPSGFEENLEVQGELILQDSFQVWDPRSLIRKGRDRHLFLFEFSLVFSKEIKDSAGRTKYQYKNRLLVGVLFRAILIMFMLKCSRCVASGHRPTDLWCFIFKSTVCLHIRQLCFPHMSLLNSSCSLDISQTSELGVTEHIEGDPCKFALWAGRTPSSDNKTVLKVPLNRYKSRRFCCVYLHPPDGCLITSPPGHQHGSEAGVDQKHPGGDPGEDDSPEGGAEGASPSAENTGADQTQEQRQEVSDNINNMNINEAPPLGSCLHQTLSFSQH